MNTIMALIGTYGLWTVLAAAFVDAAGLPIPSYPVLMAAAALAVNVHGGLLPILVTGVGGSLLADLLWFWAGRRLGNRVIRQMCRISLSPDTCIRNTGSLFTRMGPAALTITKFIPGFSNIAVVLAGATHVPIMTFLFFDIVGGCLYIGGGIILGAVFHDAISDVLDKLSEYGKGGLLVLAVALGLFILVKWVQRYRFVRQLKMDRITVTELRAMIDSGTSPVILDVRPPEYRQSQGFIPGAVFANREELDGIASTFPPGTEVVTYCSCPGEASAAMAAKHLQYLKKAGYGKIRPLRGGIEAWIEAGYAVEGLVEEKLKEMFTSAAA